MALRMAGGADSARTRALLAPAPHPRRPFAAAVAVLMPCGAGTHTEHLWLVRRAL
jgi:hypothetical protein